jgi:hypothetical protein
VHSMRCRAPIGTGHARVRIRCGEAVAGWVEELSAILTGAADAPASPPGRLRGWRRQPAIASQGCGTRPVRTDETGWTRTSTMTAHDNGRQAWERSECTNSARWTA